jgi:fermentation-respiration switch protein FrsA (DUF1100 family)
MVSERAPVQEGARARSGAPRRSREALVFGAATSLALIHALDDAFVHREPGVGAGQHAIAAGIALIAAVAAIVGYRSLRPSVRAAVSLVFGAAAGINGSLHLKHIGDQGVAGGDITGVLALGAGVVLVALAVFVPWRHRGTGAGGARKRWAYRVLSVPAVVLGVFYVVIPICIGITETHKYREKIGAPPSAEYREVTFDATDGVKLSGWYRPTRNGATLLVVHGGGGDRTGAVRHAEMLARHGYGVLLHDARGRGRSEGAQNSWGWGWDKDVAGAIAYLKSRDEVDPERLGGLGTSTGADVLVQAAARRKDLKAVVGDGTAVGQFEDWQRVEGGFHDMTPFWAMNFATVRAISGARPGPVLEDAVKTISTPVLLIAAGKLEKPFGELYDRAAGDRPVDVWYLPKAGHTAAIRQEPTYEARVTGFLDGALGVR